MDTVADALTRIKNGYMASKEVVLLPYSKFVKSICEVLQNEGYIAGFKEVASEKNEKFLNLAVDLLYKDRKPVLSEVKRVSKPGLRVYKNKQRLPYVLNGLGVAIVSTPKGVMTDRQARKEGLGGEIVAYVW